MSRPRIPPSIVGLLMAALVTLACGDAGSAREEYLESGDRLAAQGKDQEAIIQYRTAIQLDGQFGRARYQLAKAYARLGNPTRARAELIRAADLLPDDAEVQLEAAKVLLQNREFPDARTRAEQVLRLDPKSADAHMIRGRASAGLGNFEEALTEFEAGLGVNPDRSDILVDMGQVRSFQGNAEEAEASFRQAIAIAPRMVSARLSLADFYWLTGRAADAEQTILEALEIEPDHQLANRGLSMLYLQTGRAAQAEAPLKRAADADPASKLVLADYYLTLRRFDDATPVLDELTKTPTMYAPSMARRASLANYRGQRQRAYGILEEVLVKEPRNLEALVTKGRLLLMDRKFGDALGVAQTAIESDPTSWQAHEIAGSAHAGMTRLEDATKSFNEALRLNARALRAQIGLAELNAVAGRREAALRFAEEAVKTHPNSIEARLLLVRTLTSGGDVARARRELAPLTERLTNVAIVHVLNGQIAMRGGDHAAARRSFERAAQIDPASEEALAGLVAVDSTREAAARRADQYVKVPSATAAGLTTAARAYLAAGDVARAETSIRQAVNRDASYRPAYDVMASIYMRQGKLDEARRMFEQVIAERPTDVPALTMIGILLEAQGKRAEAMKAYERVLGVDSRAALAANNLAYMHAETGQNLDVALNLAQTAKAALPDDPTVSDTLGWVYYKRGLAGQAIPHLRESTTRDPDNPVYHFHLGLAYIQSGDPDRGRASLEQALRLNANFDGSAEARKALASIRG
jgi:tetratricopeptide (TPR) repeat protein